MGNELKSEEMKREKEKRKAGEKRVYVCDRCGSNMVENRCKVVCPNCGNRFDCSDLNIYFD